MEGQPPDRPKAGAATRIGAAFDPRSQIQRDPFNEYLVFVVSAGGASVLVPCLMLIISAVWDKPGLGVFIGASILLEWFGIFVLARPAMKPIEKLGWALLWGFAAAFFA